MAPLMQWLAAAVILSSILSVIFAACANEKSNGGGNMTVPTPSQVAEAGDRWGGFVFTRDGGPPLPSRTPAPAGHIHDEELIPADHPGTRRFATPADAVAAGVIDASLAVEPSFVPAQYELAGVYVVTVDGLGAVDYGLSYRRRDLAAQISMNCSRRTCGLVGHFAHRSRSL